MKLRVAQGAVARCCCKVLLQAETQRERERERLSRVLQGAAAGRVLQGAAAFK